MQETTGKGKKFGYLCMSFVPLIAYTALSFLVGIAVTIVVMIPIIMKNTAEGNGDIYSALMEKVMSTGMLTGVVYGTLGVIGMGLWYYFGCKRKNLKPPGDVRKPLNLLLIAVLAYGMQYATQLFMLAVEALLPKVMDSYEQLMEMAGVGEVNVLGVLYVVILGPIAEELTFRGVTMYYARKFTNRFWLANLIQSVLFGVMHLNLVQGIYAAILGLVIGWVYHRFRSLYACIFMHMFFNFLAYGPLEFLDGLLPQNTAFQVVWYVLMCVLVVALLWVLTKRTNGKEEAA